MKLALVSNKPYRQVRGDLEALLQQLYITDVSVEGAGEQGQSTQQGVVAISIEGKEGDNQKTKLELGKLSILPNEIVGIELDLATLVKHAKKHPAYQPIAKTTPVIEDLTFTLMPITKVGKVLDAIRQADKLVKNLELIDHYQQNHTFRIHYQDAEKNLSSLDIQPVRQKVVEAVEKKPRQGWWGGCSGERKKKLPQPFSLKSMIE